MQSHSKSSQGYPRSGLAPASSCVPLIVPIELQLARANEATAATSLEGFVDMLFPLREAGMQTA